MVKGAVYKNFMNERYCFSGIPDDQGKRALSWRLLLNYLPPERRIWQDFLQEKRDLYKQFISMYNPVLTNLLNCLKIVTLLLFVVK